MKKYKKYETILKINWSDSVMHRSVGWTNKSVIEKIIKGNDDINNLGATAYKRHESAGYYVGENEDSIFVCLSQSVFQVQEALQIPKEVIKKIKVLK